MTNQTAVTPETLPTIMWQNQPVITTELLAEIYGTVSDNIKKNFNVNQSRFIEGVHFFKLVGAELKAFKSQVTNSYPALIHKFASSLYLWTERGTVRHAKILDTDNAWAVQDRLEDFYFAKNQPATTPYALRDLPPKTLTTAMLRHIEKRINWLVRNQVGTTHASLGGQLKEKFNVHKRDQIPADKYREVCAFLDCEPDPKALQGELVEPEKLEYQPPAGMALVPVDELEMLRSLQTSKIRKSDHPNLGGIQFKIETKDGQQFVLVSLDEWENLLNYSAHRYTREDIVDIVHKEGFLLLRKEQRDNIQSAFESLSAVFAA